MDIAVTLNLIGFPSLDVPEREMSFSLAERSTIAQLLDLIDERNPGFRRAVTGEDGDISNQFVLFLNGRNIRRLNGIDTELSERDEVNMIPAVAGG